MNYKDLELKNGNVVEMKDGRKYLYLENIDTQYTKNDDIHDVFVGINCEYASWDRANYFNVDSIVAIYRVTHPYCFVANEEYMPERMLCDNLHYVKKVTPPKRMTKAEIEAELGYKIEIVN